MISRKTFGSLTLSLILACGITGRASAQTNEEAFEQFQWTVLSPGARAAAMGGVLLASANEPAAGLANPAGLRALTKPRVSVEFRSIDQRIERHAAVDSLFTGSVTSFTDRLNDLSFVGGAMPLRRGRVIVGFARYKFLEYQTAFTLPPRAVPGVIGMARAFSPVDSRIDFQGVSYAASIATAVGGRLWVGATFSFDQLDVALLNTRHDVQVGVGTFDFTELSLISNQSRIDHNAAGIGVTLGASYRPLDAVSIAIAFSKRPSFTVTENYDQDLTPATAGAGRATDRQQGPLLPASGFPKQISLDIPDQISAGVELRPHRRIIAVFEGTYVRYSDLARGLTAVVAHDVLKSSDFQIDDAGEIHLGSEVNVGSDRNPVWLRGGVLTVADHRLRFVGDVQSGGNLTPAQSQRINSLERARFNLGAHDTDLTGTVGAGIALGPRLSADVAYVWRKRLIVSVGAGF